MVLTTKLGGFTRVFFGNLGLVGGIALEIGFDLPAFDFLRF